MFAFSREEIKPMNETGALIKLMDVLSLYGDSNAIDYVVVDQNNLESAMQKIKQSHCIAVDCEGDDLSRKGALTLLQIQTDAKEIFLFDVQTIGREVMDALKPILESSSILKLGYDFRNDNDALVHQFQIHTQHLLDLQLVKFWYKEELDKEISLSQWYSQHVMKGLCYWGSLYLPPLKPKQSTLNWKQNPFTKEQLRYAANDVKLIFEEYEKHCGQLEKQEVLQKFLRASDKYIQMFSNFRSRSYNSFEVNHIMPIQVFFTNSSYEIQCSLCKCHVAMNLFGKNPKRCLRCILQQRLIEREENKRRAMYEYENRYGGDDCYDSDCYDSD